METIDPTRPVPNPRRSSPQMATATPASMSLGSEPSRAGFIPIAAAAVATSYPLAPSPCQNPVLVPALPGIPFGDRFEAVRTSHTQTLVLSLEEYFLHHCPDKLTAVYDPTEFARQLLDRGPRVEVPVWLPVDVPVEVEGCHTVLKEVQELPYAVDVDVFEEEEVIRVVEVVTEELVEVPVERIVEKVIEVEEVEFVLVPYDRVVEVVQERIVETPVPRPVELVREALVVCTTDVPVCVARERAVPLPVDHCVSMVVDRVETRIVEVPYERVVTHYVEVPYEVVVEERTDCLVEKIIEVEREAVTEKIVEREVTYEVIIEKKVIRPVEKIVERLVTVGPKQVVNEFQFEDPSPTAASAPTPTPYAATPSSSSSSSWANAGPEPSTTGRTGAIPRSNRSPMPGSEWPSQTFAPPQGRLRPQGPQQVSYSRDPHHHHHQHHHQQQQQQQQAWYPVASTTAAPPPPWPGAGAPADDPRYGSRAPAAPPPVAGHGGFPGRPDGQGGALKGSRGPRAPPLVV